MRKRSFSSPQTRGDKVFRNSKFGNRRPSKNGQYISPDKFVNKAIKPQAEDIFEPVHTFEDFDFSLTLSRNVKDRGYTQPTPIQDQTIKYALEGRDVIGLANTGTGKTAAFALPMIERLSSMDKQATGLIMAPTRELAQQISEEFAGFAKGLNIHFALCLGGSNINAQIQTLRRRPRVVIGTPGRLKDLYNRGALHLNRVEVLVLDEADRMLDMGFIRDIRFLMDKLPENKQSLCFSATLTDDIRQLMAEIMHDPITVSVAKNQTSDHVEQNIVRASSKEEKLSTLIEMLQKDHFEKVIVFGSTKYGVQRLADNLTKASIPSAAIHGNKTQPQRKKALQSFKTGKVRVLVATDVASRGLDIPLVSHVINFDQPATYEDYIHRIGRTGRAGNIGHALTFVD